MTERHPRPVATAETAPFWQASARGDLVFQRCGGCGHAQFPPRPFCVRCRSDALTWQVSAGRGRIYSFTIVRRPATPAFKADVPYVLALVDLDEGFRMMMNVRDADPAAVEIGQAIKVIFENRGDGVVLPQAAPAVGA